MSKYMLNKQRKLCCVLFLTQKYVKLRRMVRAYERSKQNNAYFGKINLKYYRPRKNYFKNIFIFSSNFININQEKCLS